MTERGRLPTIAGGILFAYLLVWMVELATIRTSTATFAQLQEWSASLPGRLVACAVFLAAVYHALEGVRAAFRRDPQADTTTSSAVIAFATWMLVVPAWVILLRPWVEDVVR